MQKKICTKCKQEKTIDMFHKHRGRKTGYREQCKTCCAEYNKLRLKDPEYRIRMNMQSRVQQQRYRENGTYSARLRAYRARRRHDPQYLAKERERHRRYYCQRRHGMAIIKMISIAYCMKDAGVGGMKSLQPDAS